MESFRYRLYGLCLSSGIALPELAAEESSGAADVEVSFGALHHLHSGSHEPVSFEPCAEGHLLSVREVARFLIAGGRRIIVDPAPGASDRNVRLFLLGSAFGALLHQRGILPIHANAIDFGSVAVAFGGHSGAGKSTIAARFAAAGRPLLSDDVCAVTFEGDAPVVHQGVPRIRLWADALQHLDRSAAGLERAFDDVDKFNLPTGRRSRGGPLPLASIYC
ncbi:MAG: hypothetical protein ACK4K7_04250 [Allosphingosinicella sp.]|uniref:hypothetical protein n=1 Tax=Allosphingosinicella sp. TaxID=2823234 RepID=UPI003957C676